MVHTKTTSLVSLFIDVFWDIRPCRIHKCQQRNAKDWSLCMVRYYRSPSCFIYDIYDVSLQVVDMLMENGDLKQSNKIDARWVSSPGCVAQHLTASLGTTIPLVHGHHHHLFRRIDDQLRGLPDTDPELCQKSCDEDFSCRKLDVFHHPWVDGFIHRRIPGNQFWLPTESHTASTWSKCPEFSMVVTHGWIGKWM